MKLVLERATKALNNMAITFERIRTGDILSLDEGQYVVIKKAKYYVYLDRHLEIDTRCWKLHRTDFDMMEFDLVQHKCFKLPKEIGLRVLHGRHVYLR